MSDAAPITVARRAHRYGVPLRVALHIAFACRRYGLRYALGYALVEQESGFQHIYGHDPGGLLPGQKVTRANYKEFRGEVTAHSGGGANGVGLTQITYWTYIRDHAGLWRQRANIYFGLGLVAATIISKGEREGLAEYNGGAGNPQFGYADEVLSRATKWRGRISKKGTHGA